MMKFFKIQCPLVTRQNLIHPPNVNNQENLYYDEYRLFGTPSSSDSSSSEDLVVEVKVDDDNDDQTNNDDADDDDEEEMDDYVGMLFFPLVNSEGLNFFE